MKNMNGLSFYVCLCVPCIARAEKEERLRQMDAEALWEEISAHEDLPDAEGTETEEPKKSK